MRLPSGLGEISCLATIIRPRRAKTDFPYLDAHGRLPHDALGWGKKKRPAVKARFNSDAVFSMSRLVERHAELCTPRLQR
jgi:hypothetical protein